MRLLIAHGLPHLPKLRPDSAGRHTHGNRLHDADLLVGQTIFLGNAKEILHSRVTADHKRRCELDHHGCFLVDYAIFDG